MMTTAIAFSISFALSTQATYLFALGQIFAILNSLFNHINAYV